MYWFPAQIGQVMRNSSPYNWQFISCPSTRVEDTGDHCDVMIWKRFPHYRSFVWGIHWSTVDSHLKGPIIGSFDTLLIAWRSISTVTRVASDLRRLERSYDATVMLLEYELWIKLELCTSWWTGNSWQQDGLNKAKRFSPLRNFLTWASFEST